MTKLNPEVKQQWIDALRSGTYTQAQGNLRQIEDNAGSVGYCCLGVLCTLNPDLVVPRGEFPGYGALPGFEGANGATYNVYNELLPTPLAERYFGGDENPQVHLHDLTNEIIETISETYFSIRGADSVGLADLNDNGVPFDVIATIIEVAL